MARLMAVINTTDQSIDAANRSVAGPVERARQAFADGAYWVDIGGQATNPWANEGSAQTEWTSIEPVLKALLKEFPGKISVDTFRPEVAAKALATHKVILNDVTMFHDPKMVALAAKYDTVCIVSHLPLAAKGKVAWAHAHANMTNEVEVLAELLQKRREMINAGVKPNRIILDPGIGFGKTPELNRRLLEFGRLATDRKLLEKFDRKALDEPPIKVLIGHSQKRLIADFFGGNKVDPEANVRAARIAVNNGASYLRVHNVSAHYDL
jgi:dihydropteroate synthase